MTAQAESIKRIQLWYQARGVKAWDRNRYHRMCALLNCTPGELAALMCVPPGLMTRWLKVNKIPLWVSVHLEVLDQAWREMTSVQKSPPLMPAHLLLSAEPKPHHD